MHVRLQIFLLKNNNKQDIFFRLKLIIYQFYNSRRMKKSANIIKKIG